MTEPIGKNVATKKKRSGGRELAGRKIIKCPNCKAFLMDVDRLTKVELYRIPTGKRKSVKYENYKQCVTCGGKVGYNLIIPSET